MIQSISLTKIYIIKEVHIHVYILCRNPKYHIHTVIECMNNIVTGLSRWRSCLRWSTQTSWPTRTPSKMGAASTSSWTTVMVETFIRRSMIRGADSSLRSRSEPGMRIYMYMEFVCVWEVEGVELQKIMNTFLLFLNLHSNLHEVSKWFYSVAIHVLCITHYTCRSSTGLCRYAWPSSMCMIERYCTET